MWRLAILCIVALMSFNNNAEAGRNRGGYYNSYGNGGGVGGYAGGGGGYAGAGGYAGGGAYAGTGGGGYDDYDDTDSYAGTGFGYSPEFGPGFIDPYLFHQQLTAQILSQHAAQNNALASTYSTGDASVTAGASSLPDDDLVQQQIAQQQAAFNNNRRQSLYNNNNNNRNGKPNRYAPSYASASGSIGPGGFYQSASVNPANPNVPNIVNRFSSSSGPGGGYQGVAVSSFSSSSDIDGKKTGHRAAQTTVNDNGKVTSYLVHS